jgi:hypothetical protein
VSTINVNITPADGDSITATFDITLPTLKDHIRLALGDAAAATGSVTGALLQDASIQTKLAQCGYLEALAQLAESLIAQYGQQPDEYDERGGIRLKWSERINAWKTIADHARTGKTRVPALQKPMRRNIGLGRTMSQSRPLNKPPGLIGVPGFRSD